MFSDLGRQAMDYIHDAQQRSILYLDAMRQSGDQYVEHVSQGKPLDKPYKLPDGTGLYLLVNKSGKYWRYDYRFEGKRKTIAYGVYPVVNF